MTPDILLARIAATEAVARAATPGPWEGYDGNGAPAHVRRKWLDEEGRRCQRVVAQMHAPPTTADAAHIATWDPARVLAVCAGAKTLVELHKVRDPSVARPICDTCWDDTFMGYVSYPCPSLSAVAAMFAEPGEES